MTTQPERIAILGGGVGAMTTAFWLTSNKGWQQRYEIDVYQMGWRLGGKGASGRNADMAQRIEEHGLHIWFGFYDNAFRVMQQAYEELARPPGSPLATWDEAFKPQHFVCLSEFIEQAWRVWPIETPTLPGTPGDLREPQNVGSALADMLDWLESWLESCLKLHVERTGTAVHPGIWQRLKLEISALLHDGWIALEDLADPLVVAHKASQVARSASKLDPADALTARHWKLVRALLKCLQAVLHEIGRINGGPASWGDEGRRLYLMVDMALALSIGMLADDVIHKGFEIINNVDFRTWLAGHGAQPISVDSAPVRGFYDLVFAYRNGDPDRPDIEAGTMLRGMLKVGLGYQGALMYKMQAGMGDVVFAPLYEVLKRRGVRFHYFHKLCELRPDATGKQVAQIELEQQATLRGDAYDPLVEVKGLPCWPSQPRYGQIDPEDAALLQAHGINLESAWSDWPQVYRQATGKPLPRKTLRSGIDFDKIVFGLSVASLAEVASPLLAVSDKLKRCSDRLATVATQAYQVWMDRDLTGLGWNYPASNGEEPVLAGFTEPFDTWASMGQLLCRETWAPDLAPKSVAYFCNALEVDAYPPFDDHGFPAACAGRAKAAAISQLQTDIHVLWPKVGTDGFPWDWLVDPAGGVGVSRFDAQYWRANVDPSERYVLSVTGSSASRLHADQSGFDNLFLAGDWLKTGLDAGCVEAAVMGGMQASRAISGWPEMIAGERGW